MKKKKYKSVITRRIIKSFQKIGICVLIVAFFAPVMAMRGTNAGFLDEEKSEGNEMKLGTLDARASYVEYFDVDGMVPGSQPNEDMTFSNEGSLDFKYGIKYKKTGGDAELCDALLLTAERNTATVYAKLPLRNFDLKSFGGNDFSINTLNHDDWNFKVELPDGAEKTLEEKDCEFSFEMNSWQTGFSDGTQGFSDQEITGIHEIETGEWLNSGDVVINELMWMGSDGHSSDEWIELKNTTDQSVDLSGWQLTKKNSSNVEVLMFTIPSGKTIAPNGFFLISEYDQAHSAISVTPNLVIGAGDTNGDEFTLANSDLQIKLYNGDWANGANIMDIADDGSGTPDEGNNGSLKQSMERDSESTYDLDGGNWHTCISGDANSLSYWDAVGNNYGTPGAANLSPVVMNEFVANPAGDDDQWVELYNLLDKDFDVSGWYFKNSSGDKIIISEDNVNSEKTVVPGGGRLVVNLGRDFLDEARDTLSFYDDMETPDDEMDDAREDVYGYENSEKEAGRSFMRLPDGIGIWVDPEATPGEKNKLGEKEADDFRLSVFEKCFDGEGKLKKKSKEDICAPIFLEYLGMIKKLDDDKINSDIEMGVLTLKKTLEENKLADLLKETEEIKAEEDVPADSEEIDMVSEADGTESDKREKTVPEPEDKIKETETAIGGEKKENMDNNIKNEVDGQI